VTRRKGDREASGWVLGDVAAGGQGYFFVPVSSPAALPCHRRVLRQDLTRSTLTERAATASLRPVRLSGGVQARLAHSQ